MEILPILFLKVPNYKYVRRYPALPKAPEGAVYNVN